MEIKKGEPRNGKTHWLLLQAFGNIGRGAVCLFVCPDGDRIKNVMRMASIILEEFSTEYRINYTEKEIILGARKIVFTTFFDLDYKLLGYGFRPDIYIDDVFDCLEAKYNIKALTFRDGDS